jgi:hypothetical protein
MKPCLEDSELLHLLVEDAGGNANHEDHLKECSRCAARYEEVARDAGTITSALTHAADNLISRKRAAQPYADAWFGDRFRIAAIFTGATALGGAAAFVLLLTLGWRPASASNQLAQAAANTSANEIASMQRPATRSRAIASNDAAAPGSRGALYTAEALTSDPIAGLAYGDSQSAADSNANDDMLFCVPGEDGTICSSSAEQG